MGDQAITLVGEQTFAAPNGTPSTELLLRQLMLINVNGLANRQRIEITNLPRNRNVSWFFLLLVITILLSQSAASEQRALFEVSDLTLTERVDADVLPGFITDPQQADLIIRQITEDYQRSLKIFSLNGDGRYVDSEINDIEIGEDVIFMDIGKVRDSQLDSIILFRRDAAWWLDPISGEEHRFLGIQSVYQNAIKDELPHLDVVKDINGDSLEDILLPGFNGYQLFIQSAPGIFAAPILMDSPPAMTTTDGYAAIVYRLSEPYLVDVNFDHKDDLLFWEAPNLRAFQQNEDGSFSTEHKLVPLGLELEGAAELAKRMSREDQSDIQARTFHKMEDINADQRPDLITRTITSEGVLSKRTTFEFFMGHQSATKALGFSEQPDTQIHSTGIQISSEEKDFNNDGMTDFIIASVDLGIGMILKALFTGSVTIDLNFYQQDPTGFPKVPNITREIKLKFSLTTGDFNAPTLLIEDVNGDQLLDLVVSDENALLLSYGDGSDRLFARKQYRFDVPMPGNPDMVDTFDLNKDGKMDIILRYKDDDRNMQRVVKILLAN